MTHDDGRMAACNVNDRAIAASAQQHVRARKASVADVSGAR
jgi:hypothetical protein